MKDSSDSHYDRAYFQWQSSIGEFGGWANRFKFEEHVGPEMKVLDFGCGGGYLLRQLDCRERWGIEVNPEAAETARENGVTVHTTPAELPEAGMDVILSNHALEHVENPLDSLRQLLRILRPGGKAVFVVPGETFEMAYQPDDVNQHLFTWSPMCLGNLFTLAGFEVIECRPLFHKWPPRYRGIARRLGPRIFHLTCRLYGWWKRDVVQVRIIARKPGPESPPPPNPPAGQDGSRDSR